jgi:para-aminobenzoate synthetase component 1
MHPIVQEVTGGQSPEVLASKLASEPGLILLRSALFDSPHARYSFLAARPFLFFRSAGSRCELETFEPPLVRVQYGNPWSVLDGLMARYELLDELDLPFPLGGCFGYWGYDLKNFVEPRLPRHAINDLELPDCWVGFYDSLLVFDHRLGKVWIVATGLAADGSRCEQRARLQAERWHQLLESDALRTCRAEVPRRRNTHLSRRSPTKADHGPAPRATLSRGDFLTRVTRAQAYIRAGDIYQVNLAQRLDVPFSHSGWELFQRLTAVSPAPFSAFIQCGDFQLVSSSPELFLRLSGSHIQTRPIKGTRPRSADVTRDAQLTYELQTSPKEMAELVMITDLLRNDLGKICEFGSVQVPELVRLERYPQVQHLVSTVEGRLRSDVTHFAALASCFPGGSITGAPKIRAMEIIDELEPVTRGPYTGALGYLGFNRESQLSIAIRSAICLEGRAYFYAGAGIVADSEPAAEYGETLAKARGFFEALRLDAYREQTAPSRSAERAARKPGV